jgi:antitoxin component YwqK of YwqJK toxin-antitoxin module
VNNTVVFREEYAHGVKNGVSVEFFKNGVPKKEVVWVDGKMNGIVREFFPSGKKKVEMHYVSDKREGWSIAYFENGMNEIEGAYVGNLRAGSWKFYNTGGDLRYELIYAAGKLQNPEILDEIQQKEFEEMEKNRGNLKDPEHFRNNPDEILR